MQELVVDKSFIDASGVAAVSELCERYQVLMIEELFFELITTSDEKRQRAFRKLPDVPSPVSLIPNIGTLLRYEKEIGKPCAPLRQHRIEEAFKFNSRLRDGTFVFQGAYADELANSRLEVESSVRGFIERCFVVCGFFPELSPDEIDVRWACFRWVQVQLIAALRIFVRYQGKMPTTTSPKFWVDAEHTMLDSYYVLFGPLCGALASRDGEIREDFSLLRPDGLLLG